MRWTRLSIVALIAVAGCVVPADVTLGPSAVNAPSENTPASASDTVVLVGETSDGSHGCFSGDLAAYAIPGGLRRRTPVPAIGGGAVASADLVAFYPRTIVEGARWRTVIERIDMRTGELTSEIDAGTGLFGNELYAEPRCHAVVAVSPDGTRLALARPGVEGLPARVQVDLFDARSGRRLATRELNATAGGTVDVTLGVLTRDRVSVTLHSYLACPGGSCRSARGEEHLELDDKLAQRGTPELGCGRGQLGPKGLLVATCGRLPDLAIGIFTTAGEPRGSVALGIDGAERFFGWRTTSDGLVLVLTDRRVIRVDPTAQRQVDARAIEWPRSLRLPFGSMIAAAKTPPPRPSVQIAADGRTAYVVAWPATAPWRAGISVVDIASAAVRASYLGEREIWGIQLSTDGSRLFVLDGSGYATGASTLLVVDSATGTVASSMKLDRPALALIAP